MNRSAAPSVARYDASLEMTSVGSGDTRGRVRAFVKLGRPRFLLGGLVLYSAGAVLARPLAELDVARWVLGQGAITATQLMTHYSNDYFDLEADRSNRAGTRWSGGSRVLVDGPLAPRVARDAALVFGAVALTLDAVIAALGAPSAGAVLLLMLVLSWSYSAPPLRLHPRGLGAFTAALVVGALTPIVGAVMQRAEITSGVLAAVAPLALAQLTMILILDLPDAPSDGAAGKRTLAVRYGTTLTARIAAGLVVLTYAVALAAFVSAPARALAMAATLPAGGAVVWELFGGRWATDASRLTGRAVFWFGSLSVALLVSGAASGAR